MKLGTKIILGFLGLLSLALLLGGTAVWQMYGVQSQAEKLSVDYLPAIVAANEVERASLQTMYEMRGYAYTENEDFLKLGRECLAGVLANLTKAEELARGSGETLDFLQEAAAAAEKDVKEYERLSEETVAVTVKLQAERQEMDQSAQEYMKVCSEYLHSQENTMMEDVRGMGGAGEGTDATQTQAKVSERLRKITLVNDVIYLGNAIRVGNFKSQALRNPELFRHAQSLFQEVNTKLDDLKSITRQEANLRQIEQCRAAARSYEKAMTDFLANWLRREELNAQRLVTATEVLKEAEGTAKASAGTSSKMADQAAHALSQASATVVVGLSGTVALGLFLAVMITRSITKPIRAVATQLSDGAEQTVTAAGQVSSSSQSLAAGASQQAASLEETSSSLEEMSSMTARNAENARQANDLAKQARQAAETGAGDMEKMAQAMDAIKASGDDIAKIIKTIDEIAFQTNILALNAAVEAARAGEAGMGFAVVADEVRNLAQRSAQAAKETTGKIATAISNTAQGVDISGKVARSLQEIVQKARQVDELVSEVTSASQEQSKGIQQVNGSVSEIDKITQSNAASAEESASAAEELNAQAEILREAVSDLRRLVDGAGANGRAQAYAAAASPTAHLARAQRPVIAKNGGNGHRHPTPARPARQGSGHHEEALAAPARGNSLHRESAQEL